MATRISVFSLKGGQGKTTTAANLFLTMKERGFPVAIITNQPETEDEPSQHRKICTDGELCCLGWSEKPPQIPIDIDVIYDLGGFVDSRAIDILKSSDVVIIPVSYEGSNEASGFRQSVSEAERYNSNIILLLNKHNTALKDSKIKGYTEFLAQVEVYKKQRGYKVFTVNNSSSVSRVISLVKSVEKQCEECTPIIKRHFQPIKNTFDEIITTATRKGGVNIG